MIQAKLSEEKKIEIEVSGEVRTFSLRPATVAEQLKIEDRVVELLKGINDGSKSLENSLELLKLLLVDYDEEFFTRKLHFSSILDVVREVAQVRGGACLVGPVGSA